MFDEEKTIELDTKLTNFSKEKIVRFDTNLTNFGEVNQGFIRATVDVCTHEQTANGFVFTKEALMAEVKNWNYVPVVGEYIEEKKDLGTHGGKLIISDNGAEYVKTTQALGVVIADTGRFENIVTKNGETQEYFRADVYLWDETFGKELEMFHRGESRPQSMEVKIRNSEYDFNSNSEYVHAFSPLALCLLGSDVPPAFHNAKITTAFESDEFKVKYQEMMFALDKFVSVQEGGVTMEDNIKEVEMTEEETVIEEVFEDAEKVVEEKKDEEDDKKKCEEDTKEETVIENAKTEENPVVNYEEVISRLEQDNLEINEKYTELENKFELVSAELETFKQEKAEQLAQMELEAKNNIISQFESQLTQEEITSVIGDVNSFSANEIESKLAVFLFKKEKETKVEEVVEEMKVFTDVNSLAKNSYSKLLNEVKKYKK